MPQSKRIPLSYSKVVFDYEQALKEAIKLSRNPKDPLDLLKARR